MLRTRAVAAALILFCWLGTAAAEAAGPSWLTTGPTAYSHMDAAAVALPGGDSALIIGGLHWTGTTHDAQLVERYDRASDRWTTMTRLAEPRRSSEAIALRDGRVLVAGGWNYPAGAVATADLYSPETDTWSAAEPMDGPRSSLRLVLLDDGKALAVGGGYGGLSEIYDPSSGHWSSGLRTGMPRSLPAVAKLADGRVLAAGGYGTWDEYASAELYDPATGTWTPIAPMHAVRVNAVAATLPDGRVLVAGGYQRSTPASAYAPADTFEIYDPADDTWTTPARLSRPRTNNARMVTLSDGRLVITGGYNAAGSPYEGEQNTADIYDPRTGTWTETPPAGASRSQHVAIALRDDSVLVAGGTFDQRTSERLVFPAPPTPPTPEPQNPTPTADAVPTPTADAVPPPRIDPLPVRPKSVLSAAARLRAKRGAVTVKVRCAGPGVCAERLTLRVRGGRTLARTDVTVAPGKTRTVRLMLSKADRRRLAKRATKVTLTLGPTTRNATLRV